MKLAKEDLNRCTAGSLVVMAVLTLLSGRCDSAEEPSKTRFMTALEKTYHKEPGAATFLQWAFWHGRLCAFYAALRLVLDSLRPMGALPQVPLGDNPLKLE